MQNSSQFSLTTQDDMIYADSRIVAEGLGLDHASVLKAISRSAERFSDCQSVNLSQSGFAGRPRRHYLLTRRAVMILPVLCNATEETLDFQQAIIDEFERMEAALREPRPFKLENTVESLTFALENLRKRQEAEAQVLALTPKAAAWERFTDSEGLISLGEFAKLLNIRTDTRRAIGRNLLINAMKSAGFLCQNGEPKQQYIDCGWMAVKTWIKGTHTGIQAFITNRGVAPLADRIVDYLNGGGNHGI